MDSPSNITSNTSKETYEFSWFLNASEIKPGASAILGGKRLPFFAIHHIALCIITISVVSSWLVISEIYSKWKKHSSTLNFPVRFPLYLATADVLWGLSHFVDHFYLVTEQVYPNNSVKLGLSINLWFFFGYQQLMHATIAGYTYFRVVHMKKMNLGKWEWKLHVLWFGFLIATIFVFYYLDSFGSGGYWMLADASTLNGQILGVVVALTSTFNAFSTTAGHYSIRRTVDKIKGNLQTGQKEKKQSVSSQCLTTYVYIAACLYCPLALLCWINIFFQFLGKIEPLSAFLIVIVANSSGWTNAYGYFKNEKLKKRRSKKMANSAVNSSALVTTSMDSNFSTSYA